MDFQENVENDGSFEDKTLKEERKQKRKAYQKNYHKEYRKQFKRIEILFLPSEYEVIQKMARTYDEKPTTFIRKATLSFLDSKVYLPKNESLEEAKMLFRRNSNNLNQLIKTSHIQLFVDAMRLKELVSEQRQMQKVLNDLYYSQKVLFIPINLIEDAHKSKDQTTRPP